LIIYHQFLLLVSERKIKEAYLLIDKILKFEPNNKLILEYEAALKEYIRQGFLILLI
jgi:hypothetical protein